MPAPPAAAAARPLPAACCVRVFTHLCRLAHPLQLITMDDTVDCPLCCAELDVTDRAIQYCECGCAWADVAVQRGASAGGRLCAQPAAPACRGSTAGRVTGAPPPTRLGTAGTPSLGLTPPQRPALCPLPAGAPADQMCLWCYHHILEEAAKASLAARCPNCRAEYDEEKIQMQHIDAEQ